MKVVLLSLLAILVVPTIAFVGCGVYYYNEEVGLRTAHEANEDANKIVYNKFVNVISEKAGVVNASVDAQKELFAIIMNSKKGTTGTLLNFIHQHNPNPDQALTETSAMFRDLMASIEGLREEFAKVQKKSRDIEREHTNLIGSFFPKNIFLPMFGANTEPLETQIVVGPETDDAFNGGGDKGINTRDLLKKD